MKRLKAEAAKERGNDSFKAKDYPVALEHYTEAIKMDNTNSTYYSNRCCPSLLLCTFSSELSSVIMISNTNASRVLCVGTWYSAPIQVHTVSKDVWFHGMRCKLACMLSV